MMEQLGISKLDLKRQNRMQILKVIKQKGPVSRIDIANYLEITRAAVTIITNGMIEQGIIEEIGEFKHINEKAPRGRKKILININGNYRFIVGVTVEATEINIGLSNLFGEVLDKITYSCNGKLDVDSLTMFIKKSYFDILKKNCLTEDRILGMGIAIMPELYTELGINVNQETTDYSSVITRIAKFTDINIVADNCVKGLAMASIDFPKNKEPDRKNIGFLKFGKAYNFVFANLNSPIVSYDNRTDFVNNIIVNNASEDRANGKVKGSVNAELTSDAVIGKIKKVYSKTGTPELYNLTEGNEDNISMELFRKAMQKGDIKLHKIYDEWIFNLAILINNLIFITDPEKLVLHDFLFTENDIEILARAVADLSGKNAAAKLVLSPIDERNRFLGGAAVAIRELFYTKGGF